jgi:tetratricopeptide (TPR) repeat protein
MTTAAVGNRHLPSFEAAHTRSHPVEPQRKLANAFLNNVHEARDRGDPAAVQQFGDLAREQIQLFESDQSKTHSNPRWIVATMWAAYHFALGEIEAALKFDLQAEAVARSDEEKAKTAHNVSEERRHLGDFKDALEGAEQAIKLDPTLAPAYVNLVLCRNAVGDLEGANRLLERLMSAANFANSRDMLAAALRFDREIHTLGLPAAAKLRELL